MATRLVMCARSMAVRVKRASCRKPYQAGLKAVEVERPDEKNYIPVSLSDSDTDVAEAGAEKPGIQPSATPLSDNFFHGVSVAISAQDTDPALCKLEYAAEFLRMGNFEEHGTAGGQERFEELLEHATWVRKYYQECECKNGKSRDANPTTAGDEDEHDGLHEDHSRSMSGADSDSVGKPVETAGCDGATCSAAKPITAGKAANSNKKILTYDKDEAL